MNFRKYLLTIVMSLFIIISIPCIANATDYIVCLDAGHSNNSNFQEDIKWFEEVNGDKWDNGKYGTKPDYDNEVNGIIKTTESALTKETVIYMMEYLKQYDNIKVVLSPRTGDGYYSQRPYYGKDKGANVHVSVHYDAPEDGGQSKGPLSIYKPGDETSKKFASLVLDSVVDATKLNNRGARADDRGLGILRNSSQMNGAPSMVLECACFDNAEDLAFISEKANMKKIAAGAVSGILAYLGVEDKGYPDIPDYNGYSGSSSSGGGNITSNEKKFLGLWKNPTGTYEPYYKKDGKTINENALYDKNGTEVIYSSNTQHVAGDIINAATWFFELLESSERTQNHLTIMKYLMNVYTDSNDYGDLTFEKDIASLFSSSSGFTNMSSIYGGTIQEKVWFALRDAGFSEEATAGVMGNISQESSWNKDDVNSSSGAKGLCQWLGGRAEGLDKYAASKGVDWKDENIQVEYLIGELTPGGGADGYATYNLMSSNGCSPDDWKNASTPEDAAVAFRKTFERCGDAEANDDRRKSEARKFYDEFKGKTRSSGGSFTATSDDERVNGYYTSSKGKKFTILNQNKISGWGDKCNRAASAIVASGYSNQNADELINYINNNYDAGYGVIPSNKYWNAYGLKVTSNDTTNPSHDYMNKLKNQLNSGGYALVWLGFSQTYIGKSGTKWTGNIHWMAIIDYRNENGTDKICIADWRGITWVDIDEFSEKGVSIMLYINEK